VITTRQNVLLAERTTLEVGGPARWWVEACDVAQVQEALQWASDRAMAVQVLGGGSNVLVADRGIDGLVLRVRADEIREQREGDEVVVDVGAGMSWDAWVDWAVARGYAGVECMSGIPGDVGAAPMQNVGAYGQEVSSVIEEVHAIDRASGARRVFAAHECQFGYRDSVFKHAAAGQYVVSSVRFRLKIGGAPTVTYAELQRAVGEVSPSLAQVRETVIALRRRKSMVLDSSDDNRRSAGSFFVNPVVAADDAARVAAIVDEPMPQYPVADGQVKLAAAWLIERAGMLKGARRGNVGISTRHSLAIINLGGATAAEVVAFASDVRARVYERFGVLLMPEPRPIGFEEGEIAALYGQAASGARP